MATFDQTSRLLSITTPLTADEVLLTSFQGSEAVSRPFGFQLQVISSLLDIQPADIVGQKILVTVQWRQPPPDGDGDDVDKLAYFHGYVSRFSAGGLVSFDPELRAYQFEMVSWLWFLSLESGCQIFQDMTVPDIVEQVINKANLADTPTITKSLKGTYANLDFCVQYRETNLDFISRLMEQAGIFYFFKHEKDTLSLVLADDVSAYAACADAKIEYADAYGGDSLGQVTSWGHRYSLISGKYTHTDYNFETPALSLLKSQPMVGPLSAVSQDQFEIYDYPGIYGKAADGESLANLRMQEREAAQEIISGSSTCPLFSSGVKFMLADHPADAENNKDVVVVSVDHTARAPWQAAQGHTGEMTDEYSNTFSAIPASVVFRPPRTTPVPTVRGLQTAVVVGASGDEITTDKYGRVKVQFFWDRLGKNDDKSSCFVRVAQGWGGKNWGLLFTPRLGDEVLVDFLEGNPDRPIIIGSVYNADNMPPYKLAKDDGSPDTQLNYSGIKTFSTKSGTATNFNELRFKDDLGKEEIFFHAERDFTREVENDDILTVGIENDADGKPALGVAGKASGNQTITLFNNQTLTIGKKVGSTAPADGSQTVEIWKNQTLTIGKGKADCADGSQLLTIFKDQTVNIGDPATTDGSQTVTINKSRTVTLKTGDDTLTVTQGNQAVQIKAGASSLDAMQSILLKVGENSIKIAPDGITIKGTMVTIEGQAAFKAKAPLCDVLADGILTLKGGLVKIN